MFTVGSGDNGGDRVGWMKAYDASNVAVAFLHVTEGEWSYRVCTSMHLPSWDLDFAFIVVLHLLF